MKINEYNSWVIDFYKKRNWYQYDPFIRVGFLTEEVGELSGPFAALKLGEIDLMSLQKIKPTIERI